MLEPTGCVQTHNTIAPFSWRKVSFSILMVERRRVYLTKWRAQENRDRDVSDGACESGVGSGLCVYITRQRGDTSIA